MTTTLNLSGVNGTAAMVDSGNRRIESAVKASRQRKPQAAQDKPSRPRSTNRRPVRLTARQRSAVAIGIVATAVLVLSLWHVTEAIATLTGTHLILAALLAIGIDAGLVACELGAIVGDGRAKRWCEVYVLSAIVLSVGLNAYASALHAPNGMAWLAALLGGVLPGLVYAAARGAGHMWRDKPIPATEVKVGKARAAK